MNANNTHLVVVGSGIAGLYGSLMAAASGLRVTLISKGALAASNTHFAQGGICAVLGPGEAAPEDTVAAHIADTLRAGAGHCDPEAVRILCSEAYGDILALEKFGVVFDLDNATGKRALGLEGAHSAARILHAGGDATGAAIAQGLIKAVGEVQKMGTLEIRENTFMEDFIMVGGRVVGVTVQEATGERTELLADSVLLASGGAGQLYAHTTNPQIATADGVAAAHRAGAVLADIEFFQFHPTALAAEGNFLISEAVRGAGAVLRDRHGKAFMTDYHPEGDLAPRDIVSRSIVAHLRRLGASPDETVFLDATGVEAVHGAGYLAQRFPTIDAQTRKLGFDWRREWLPVTPAAHYWMGGVASDLDGRTSLPGLFVAGEVACTGVHGANRLASNSLLEGLVFGRRAVAAIVGEHKRQTSSAEYEPELQTEHHSSKFASETAKDPVLPQPRNRASLQELMSSQAGVERNAQGLKAALAQVHKWRSVEVSRVDVQGAELENLLLVSELILEAALQRENSLGAHYRSDFPQPPVSALRKPSLESHQNSSILESELA